MHRPETPPLVIVQPSGRRFGLDFVDSNTIDVVKAGIARVTGIPPDQQQLSYRNRVLEDSKMLWEYHIHAGSCVELDFVDETMEHVDRSHDAAYELGFAAFELDDVAPVAPPGAPGPRTSSAQTRLSSTTWRVLCRLLRRRVRRLRRRVQAAQAAQYDDTALALQRTSRPGADLAPALADHAPGDPGAVLAPGLADEEQEGEGVVTLYLTTSTGRLIIVDVKGDDTIGMVKAKIHVQSGIPQKDQVLVCAGEQLENSRELGFYSDDNSETMVVYLELLGHHRLEVQLDSKIVLLDLEPLDNVNQVKAKIHQREGILPARQVLTYTDGTPVNMNIRKLHRAQRILCGL